MTRTNFLALGVAACLAVGCAAPPAGTTADGLQRASSSRLDELYLRPGADLAAYRRVYIEPVSAQLRSDYARQTHAYNRVPPLYPTYEDAESMASDMAALLQKSLADAFSAAGYGIATEPQAGVLRVSAKIADLFVNAPDRISPSARATLTRDAGEATLSLEARDGIDGTALARVVHHGIARQATRANLASDISNRMWFEAMFRRWSASCVAELKSAHRLAGAP